MRCARRCNQAALLQEEVIFLRILSCYYAQPSLTTGTPAPATRTSAGFNAGYVWTISTVAAMGGLLFGYDWIVISGTDLFYEAHFHSPPRSRSAGRKAARCWAASSARWCPARSATSLAGNGCLPCPPCSSPCPPWRPGWRVLRRVCALADCGRRGHRPGLQPVAHVYRRGRPRPDARPFGLPQPAHHRHRHPAGPVRQLVHRQPASPARPPTAEQIAASWSGQSGWRWMFGVTAAPSVLFLIGMFFVPESPRWLAKNGSRTQARGILAQHRRQRLRRRRAGRHPSHARQRRPRKSTSATCSSRSSCACCSSASLWPCSSSGAAST